MPESLTTILLRKGEEIRWHVHEVTHDDCGQTFLVAETSVIGFTGTAESLRRFTDSLLTAIQEYEGSKVHG